MKVTKPLNNILNSKVKLECLRYLINYPSELNGSELSRFLKITTRSIHKAMQSLVNEGVVDFTPRGNSYGYTLNKDKWFVKTYYYHYFIMKKDF